MSRKLKRAKKTRLRNIDKPASKEQFFHADIVSGESIRIFGQVSRGGIGYEGYPFDRTFRIGDRALWFASYVSAQGRVVFHGGRILAIGSKTVTIADEDAAYRNHRVTIKDFGLANYRTHEE